MDFDENPDQEFLKKINNSMGAVIGLLQAIVPEHKVASQDAIMVNVLCGCILKLAMQYYDNMEDMTVFVDSVKEAMLRNYEENLKKWEQNG